MPRPSRPEPALPPAAAAAALDPADLLNAFDEPCAVLDAAGALLAGNAAFELLDAEARAEAAAGEGAWTVRPLPNGGRLLRRTPDAERLKAREQFLTVMSHEIRTPLNGVLGMAGLLSQTRLDATQAAYLAAVRESGDHLLGLVDQLLDLAKLDATGVQLEPTAVDVEQLLQGVCELLSPRAYAKGLEIAWASDFDLPPILADDGRIKQILFNLAGNAVKFTETGGVLLTAERRPGAGRELRLRFAVTDTGAGVSSAARERIFEAFVQAEAGHDAKHGGVGLGLAVVSRLAEAMGGAVGLDAPASGGSEFWFEAPFRPLGAAEFSAALRGVTVAVVSPSAVVREAAVRQVESSGGRARAFSELPPRGTAADVFLIDHAGRGRKLAARDRDRPAVVLLAPEERERIGRYRAAGYAGYLIKPLRRASLAARLRAALEGPSETTAPAEPGTAEDERLEAAGSQGARILLAEDNPVNALLASSLLKRQGCVVDRVSTGEEALAALARAHYDLVLMDVRMPVMDGLEATRIYRTRGGRTPVVALTANAFEEDRRACADAGMDDFLTKPLDVGALRAAVTRWTQAPTQDKLAS
ncbi:MAG: response regulator [Pseudomonadota bacterium]|nr:response regulator [Pseudomonadota bacterium]